MYAVKKILGLSPFSTVRGESVDESHDSFSKPTQQKRVFLSFRGEDIRDNFKSHLDAGFRRKQIEVYIDDKSLPRGEEISQALINAIEGSAVAVIIFSVNYADSSWCLDELVHILRCRKSHGMLVIPVFFNVDPSDVRKQKGVFENALNRVKKHGKVRLREWRDALTAAANLSGWDSSTIRNDAELVEMIVRDIMQKLRGEPTVDFTGLVGFPDRLKAVESMLNISSDNVRIIGIGGMGGIGKTTVAKTVYRRISFLFDACCFIENVGDKWKEGRGACKLQDKLISDLFPEEKVQYITFDYTRLKSKKVLIVLDDVDDSRQLNDITGGRDRYGAGSRIILTGRDEEAFVGLDDKFQVPELSTDEALELFQSKAFEINPLTEDQIERSKMVFRKYLKTEFNPLDLTTLATTLRPKSFDRWDGVLKKMSACPDERVQKILKRSYDILREENKLIFLDIACFFNKESRDLAERILNGPGFSADEGIEDLIHKYLLNIVDSNKLWMQRLIEAMGREIVRTESGEPGERSRLWTPQDLCHVFKHNSETNKIQGISLDMFDINMVDVSPGVFSKMYNLRVLKFHTYSRKCTLKFPPHEEQLHSLPENLRYLYWDGYPFISLPLQFSGLKLVELKMQSSNLERLWEGVQNLECLRVLDLSFSKQLIEIPNLSRATKVESVCLRGCDRVREVPQYFEHLEHLNSLDLQDCSSLETVSALPRNIADVNLSCCVSLRSLPNNITTLNDRLNLRLRGCSSFEYNPEILAFLRDVE